MNSPDLLLGSYRLQGHSRRNYIPTSHRRDGLIEWMKEMLVHSFVLNNTDSYLGNNALSYTLILYYF